MLINQEINNILDEELRRLVDEIKANSNDRSVRDSVKYNLSDDNNVDVLMSEIGLFDDKGVSGNNASGFKGKRKPIHKSYSNFKFKSKVIGGKSSIDKWMSKNGIVGGKKVNGKIVSKDSVNFLIRRSIAQHGLKGTLFASNAFEEFNEELTERLNNIDFKNIINNK